MLAVLQMGPRTSPPQTGRATRRRACNAETESGAPALRVRRTRWTGEAEEEESVVVMVQQGKERGRGRDSRCNHPPTREGETQTQKVRSGMHHHCPHLDSEAVIWQNRIRGIRASVRISRRAQQTRYPAPRIPVRGFWLEFSMGIVRSLSIAGVEVKVTTEYREWMFFSSSLF